MRAFASYNRSVTQERGNEDLAWEMLDEVGHGLYAGERYGVQGILAREWTNAGSVDEHTQAAILNSTDLLSH